ncbi:MAG: HEAT repeat domain-containing protein [Cyanobacteria bacterium P01_A01_bin.135]
MVRSKRLEAAIAQLNAARQNPSSKAAIAIIQQTLGSKFSIAVAQAAKLVADAELYLLIPDLVHAFERLMEHPVDRDPGCKGKERLADALYRLEFSGERLFLRGIHHVQMEPVWGTRVDTAAGLRGTCALGLVRMNYPEVMVELADLLADPEPPARILAAQAIAYADSPASVPLLRLKVRLGDDNLQVVSDCLTGLIKLAPEPSLPFVAQYLSAADPVAEVAALALGESRLAAALPLLKGSWHQATDPEFRRLALMAIAMLRQDEAIAFLLGLIEGGSEADASSAMEALRPYRQDQALWERVEQAAHSREAALADRQTNTLSNQP